MNTYRLKRDIETEGGYDVLVAGGGPAGTAAAVQAVNNNETACALDSAKLASTLRNNGAILPE